MLRLRRKVFGGGGELFLQALLLLRLRRKVFGGGGEFSLESFHLDIRSGLKRLQASFSHRELAFEPGLFFFGNFEFGLQRGSSFLGSFDFRLQLHPSFFRLLELLLQVVQFALGRVVRHLQLAAGPLQLFEVRLQ